MPAALLISPSFKLGLLILRLVTSLAASVSLWRHYRSQPVPSLYYLALSLSCVFLQSFFQVTEAASLVLSGTPLFEVIEPLALHLFKLAWVVLLVYAVAIATPLFPFLTRYFLVANVCGMTLLSAATWLCWVQYLDVAPALRRRFFFFWGDLVYELWILVLLALGVACALAARGAWSRAFIWALALVGAGQCLHLVKFALPLPLEPLAGTVVRLMQILFCLIMALALPLPEPARQPAAAVAVPAAGDPVP